MSVPANRKTNAPYSVYQYWPADGFDWITDRYLHINDYANLASAKAAMIDATQRTEEFNKDNQEFPLDCIYKIYDNQRKAFISDHPVFSAPSQTKE